MVRELKTFSGRNPSQNAFELDALIALIQQRKVKSYLEIGARDGDTFHEIMTALPRGSRGVAMDLPGGLWGNQRTRARLERALADLHSQGYQVSALFGDSTTLATRTLARLRGPYDAILIDGDHTYEGVAADWVHYGDMAPLVAFHDIVGEGQCEKVYGRAVEVPRLWAEIKASMPAAGCIEMVADGSKMGIGVVVR